MKAWHFRDSLMMVVTTVNGEDDVPCVWMFVQILGKKNSLITLARKIKVKSKMKKQYCHWKIFNFSLRPFTRCYAGGEFYGQFICCADSHCKQTTLHDFNSSGFHLTLLLTLSAHAREGYSSHFVCHSVCVSLFDFGEGAVFRVETYIDTF